MSSLMTASKAPLSDSDIQRLVKSDSADDRAVATHKICRAMEKNELTEDERKAAYDIIRIMAADAAELVRRALAVTLKSSELIPHDVAIRLALDVTSVAIPLLSSSPVFSDNDLRDIIKSGGATRQVAIAKRPVLSEQITEAIAEFGVEEAVVTAAANDNAAFSENGLMRVMDRFGNSEVVQEVMINREALPIAISERLVHVASGALCQLLISRHKIRPELALEITSQTKERATIELADQANVHRDPKELVRHLMSQDRLTPSLILRGLVRGHMRFFEHALSELSGVAHDRTWLMIHDAGSLGFKAIYDRAGLPSRLYPTFKMAFDTYRSIVSEGHDMDAKSFQNRMIERFLTQKPYAAKEDLIYLFERLDMDRRDKVRQTLKNTRRDLTAA
jgi:uncharacterized protein (DUF2336 family)